MTYLKDPENRKMVGSYMVIETDTLEEVEEFIKTDAYYTENVVSIHGHM